MWVAIGIPCAWVASRLPYQAIRQISWLAIVVSVVLLGADREVRRASSTATRTGWPSARSQIQPSEIAKLAIVLWAAHVYAQKERRLGSLHQVMVPVVPGAARHHRCWSSSARDLGTALVLCRDPAGDALGGRRARPAVHARAVGDRRGRGLAGHHQLRATRAAHQLRRPVQGLPRRGLAARPRPLRALQRRLVRRGHRRQPAEVGRPARGPHRLHLRGARRGARPGRHAAGDRAVPRPSRTPRSGSPRTPTTRSSATCPSASWPGCSAR